jgi:hypothetical protein
MRPTPPLVPAVRRALGLLVVGLLLIQSLMVVHAAMLPSDGALDPTFDPGTGANDVVYTLAVQADGKVLMGASSPGSTVRPAAASRV